MEHSREGAGPREPRGAPGAWGRRGRLGSGLLGVALGLLWAGLAPPAGAGEIYEDPHGEIFARTSYPSATQCATCHKKIYNEWASSNHAYASISPMFHKFEQTINNLSFGTVGYFCMRCHASVGTTLKESRDLPLWERAQVSREGVTCISCHRVKNKYGRVNGARRIVPGEIYEPVYGNLDGEGVAEVVSDPQAWNVKPSPDMPGIGQAIHREAIQFEHISKSDFCVSCHQVAVHPGIKLEVVWEQYRAAPSFYRGESCQDCHMGKEPGVVSGYERGPVAIVNGKAVRPDRKHSNHAFYGPGYPIAHPGIFPHNPDNAEFEIQDWLEFDYRADWGVEDWEIQVADGEIEASFPEVWENVEDRIRAREIINDNLELLEEKKRLRQAVMSNGSHVEGPFFSGDPRVGKSLRFDMTIENTNPGHNLPSGSLGAQPELWLNVAVADPDGQRVWESGYVDANGDMADLHSLEVAKGNIEHDDQLVNLQTKFLITNVKGTDREWYLPVNVDVDQIPFIRPGAQPVSVMNHPPFIRMEGRSLPPLKKRKVSYRVPGKAITKPGTYKMSVRMRSRAEPIYFMRFVGATSEMEQAMNEWMLDIDNYTVEFDVQ